ncbi:MmcQ/YjbR family DNA-binding protein, partial [Treponema sp.]|uniref:MmcQ/YjbR family DNA-binding protein n=1 Tax=Treponema sp. TaxID=166 RepID=UPI0025D9C482
SYLINTSIPQKDKLLEYGFVQKDSSLFLKKDIDDDFYAEILIKEKEITVEAIEKSLGEKYALLNVKGVHGSFVAGLRTKITQIMEDIQHKCFYSDDLRQPYVEWMEEKYNCKGDFPWDSDPDYEVFRCPNNKWFALIMKIPLNRLGIKSDEKVNVVNIKAEHIPELIDNKSIFPAWHMNKKYWITILLTSVTDFNKLCKLTEESYTLVS